MSDREELILALKAAAPRALPSNTDSLHIELLANELLANDVKVQKHGRWILHKHGKATCDQCRFTQENVWDYDRWQRYCGVCGALMDKAEGE